MVLCPRRRSADLGLQSRIGLASSREAPSNQRTLFATADHRPFQWRGITAFRLLEYVARGREDDVDRFLSWAEGQRLTVVRVLAMGQGFMSLSAEDGRRATMPSSVPLAAPRLVDFEVDEVAGDRMQRHKLLTDT